MENSDKGQSLIGKIGVNEAITELRDLKNEKKEIADKEKALGVQIKLREEVILKHMEDNELTKITHECGTASLTIKVFAQADTEHWEDIYKWCVESGNSHLLYKKLSDKQFETLIEEGVEVPHVTPHTKTTIGFRKK